jgi:hypothetical protein
VTEEYPTEAATTVDVPVNPMHGTNPHPPRTTNRDRPRPSGDGVARATATADGARAGTEAYEGLRARVDHETDARTMTHTDPTFDDPRRDGAGTRQAGVTSP